MEGMRALLRGSLGKSLATLTPLDRLAAAWPVACGSALAARGELLALEEGRLTIRVADAAWLDQMRAMRQHLTGELARIAAVELREIHFEGGNERPRAGARPSADAPGKRVRPVQDATAKLRRGGLASPRNKG